MQAFRNLGSAHSVCRQQHHPCSPHVSCAPYDATANRSSFDRYDFLYEGPAGDEHAFPSSDDEAAVIVSNDTQPLRLVKVPGLSLPTRDVEFPNGEVHRFQEEKSVWRLKQMRDRFGNTVNVTYTYITIDGKERDAKWTITDSSGRLHSISFIHHSALQETWSLGQSIDKIVLAGFAGAATTYTFTYTSINAMPLLQKVAQPDGTSYTFAYESTYPLSSVTLPTGGTIAYTYQDYHFASETDVCQNGPVGTSTDTDGIKTRSLSDGVTTRTWEYFQRRGPKVAVDYHSPEPCDPHYDFGPFYWIRASVLAPLDASNKRVRTDHYFNIFGVPPYPDSDAHAFPEANNLPFGYAGVAGRPPDDRAKGPLTVIPEDTIGYPADVSGSDGDTEGRFLSSRIYGGCDAAGDCTNGTLLRSTYVSHECDGSVKCAVLSTRTVQEDDTSCGDACYTEETSSDRTGGGLYTTVTTRSNIPAAGTDCTTVASCPNAVTGTSYTAYPAWNGNSDNEISVLDHRCAAGGPHAQRSDARRGGRPDPLRVRRER